VFSLVWQAGKRNFLLFPNVTVGTSSERFMKFDLWAFGIFILIRSSCCIRAPYVPEVRKRRIPHMAGFVGVAPVIAFIPFLFLHRSQNVAFMRVV
jgi:hypothetical protein